MHGRLCAGHRHQFRIKESYTALNLPYDVSSIMHYSQYVFAKVSRGFLIFYVM